MAKKDKPVDTPTEPEETHDPLEEKLPEEPAEEPKTEEKHSLLEAKARDRSDDGVFKRFGHWLKSHKKLSVFLAIVVLVSVIMAIPVTKYKVLGLFVSKNYSVTVLDAESSKPVSGAAVSLAGKTAETDAEGKAVLAEVKPGPAELKVTKKYYQDGTADVTVNLSDDKNSKEMKLQATGRQVPVSVKHKITGKVLAGATVKALDTEAKTNDKGEAVIVVPADQQKLNVTISAKGYNDTKTELVVTEEAGKNDFTLTPTGKVYFLSKKSGKIDVVKTNLDGTDRKTVLAGTGRENETETVLLASRDWKYLALKASRESDIAKLYLIETETDKLTVMDEGNATFQLTGWQDHNFIFHVTRNKELWESKRQVLKSYNAESKTLTAMVETGAVQSGSFDYQYEEIEDIYLTKDAVLYNIEWYWCCRRGGVGNRQRQAYAGKAGTAQKTLLKNFTASIYDYIETKPAEPNVVYYSLYNESLRKQEIYEYKDGKFAASKVNVQEYNAKVYSRYLQSPDGYALFWAESRDGKNTLFLGSNADEGKQIATASAYTPYGWYTNNYLLVSKDNSELYIMGTGKDSKPVKVSDYHRPAFNTRGYGGGY